MRKRARLTQLSVVPTYYISPVALACVLTGDWYRPPKKQKSWWNLIRNLKYYPLRRVELYTTCIWTLDLRCSLQGLHRVTLALTDLRVFGKVQVVSDNSQILLTPTLQCVVMCVWVWVCVCVCVCVCIHNETKLTTTHSTTHPTQWKPSVLSSRQLDMYRRWDNSST